MSSAMIPPATKKTSAVAMYMIPIRLWSTVTSQRATRPVVHEAGRLAANGARSLVDVRLGVRRQRLQLRGRPRVGDRRHLAAAVAHDRGEPGALRQQRIAREVGTVAALSLHPVAGRAHALELGTAEVADRGRADVPAVVLRRRSDDPRPHRLVVEAAELRGLPVVGPGPVGA